MLGDLDQHWGPNSGLCLAQRLESNVWLIGFSLSWRVLREELCSPSPNVKWPAQPAHYEHRELPTHKPVFTAVVCRADFSFGAGGTDRLCLMLRRSGVVNR